jgi:GT2 family glycosyltransferase
MAGSSQTNPAVSICILTFNRCSLLRDLLAELKGLKYVPLEIVVVDNHSEDMTQTMMKQNFPSVTYIRTERNIGAAGRNLGMQGSTGDVIVTLDDDVTGLTDAALHSLARQFGEDPKLGAVNFRIMNGEGRTCNWVHHCREEEFFDKTFLTYEITEGAVAFRKDALRLSGYYPDTFFLSHEGPDLAFRILDRGFKVIYTGDITVQHSFAQESREPWRNYYYDTRNQLWLAARHFPLSYGVTYLARGLLSMLMYSLRDGYFVYWLRAIADGLRGLRRALNERKVLTNATMNTVREIDSQRPSIFYLIKHRFIARRNLLFK